MDEVAACRRVARDAVRDIEPERLRRTMDDLLAEASMTPGVLTLRAAAAARAAEGDAAVTVTVEGAPTDGETESADTDGGATTADATAGNGTDPLPDHVGERAAGVQLIYEGLRLIRRLASDDPWTPAPGATDTDHTSDNVAVLAADVLVSRGFYLLARTAAADRAVQTVRNFGRDQTLARSRDQNVEGGEPDEREDAPTATSEREDPDHNLEVDVLRLALVAGATCAEGVSPAPDALSSVATLAQSVEGPLPGPGTTLDGVSVGNSAAGVGVDGDGTATRTSATDS